MKKIRMMQIQGAETGELFLHIVIFDIRLHQISYNVKQYFEKVVLVYGIPLRYNRA